MTQAPPPQSVPGGHMRPHRGVMILVFGIIGLVLCIIFGILAWVMGNGDLREMDAGRMDPCGRSLTQVGKILGIVAVALWAVGIILWILMMAIAMMPIALAAP